MELFVVAMLSGSLPSREHPFGSRRDQARFQAILIILTTLYLFVASFFAPEIPIATFETVVANAAHRPCYLTKHGIAVASDGTVPCPPHWEVERQTEWMARRVGREDDLGKLSGSILIVTKNQIICDSWSGSVAGCTDLAEQGGSPTMVIAFNRFYWKGSLVHEELHIVLGGDGSHSAWEWCVLDSDYCRDAWREW